MTKLEEMQARLASLLNTMQEHIDKNELDEAEAAKAELDKLADKIEKQKLVDKLTEQNRIPGKPAETAPGEAGKAADSASFIRACIKSFSGKPLTDAENSLLLPTASTPAGTNGEGYILPEDVQTRINKRIRDFRSMRSVCGSIRTTALKGSFPAENIDSLTGLVDFTDGTDGEDSTDFSFTQISFSLKEKAAFIKLSNTLLALTDNDLVAYIVDIFAKKAVITENAMAVAAIEKGKTKKTLAGWNALKSSINKDLDPAALYGTVIVTNQDGFDALDSALDSTGRPVLQPDPANPTSKRFVGYPVVVFSNALLASTAATSSKDGYAPVYYGNLEEGVKFVDLGQTQFAASREAGFMSNTTIARLIEFVDVVQNDASDKCYCVGQLKVADKTGS
ncbi:MAG: phage major capsid protein [Ruminococcus sp.]|nr:phage major capsid protein [Ruminococcus sp.]